MVVEMRWWCVQILGDLYDLYGMCVESNVKTFNDFTYARRGMYEESASDENAFFLLFFFCACTLLPLLSSGELGTAMVTRLTWKQPVATNNSSVRYPATLVE